MTLEEKLTNYLVKFAKIDSGVISANATKQCPTNPSQINMSKAIIADLEKLGIPYYSNENGFVIGYIKGNTTGETVAFMAHMDTAEGVNNQNVNPLVHKNYNGDDIKLKNDVIISSKSDRDLAKYIGDTIITADGTSLLGGDDKAGIAIILTFAQELLNDKTALYSDIELIFTPDEEGGDGMSYFPATKVKASYAYTIDGGEQGEVEYECYYAKKAVISFKGVSIHPGYARGKMVNAISMASSFTNLLPRNESPEATDGYYGCYWVDTFNGDTDSTTISVQVRDHDLAILESRISALETYKNAILAAYPNGKIEITITNQYDNMRKAIESKPFVMQKLLTAMQHSSVEPIIKPIRGGTDGARLSAMGIPCPNIFTGNHNGHGLKEWVSVSTMKKAVDVLLCIVKTI